MQVPRFTKSTFQVNFACMAKYQLSFNLLGFNCVVGMSCLVKKQEYDNVGGMANYGDYLSDDYFYTNAIKKRLVVLM